jgi:GT2 family glycosyltransferase
MIPVVGVPILNRGDLLLRCVESIDYPVNILVIINNGTDEGVTKALVDLGGRTSQRSLWEHLVVVPPSTDPLHHRGNRGVAGSWNEIIRFIPTAAYWLLVGNDIAFGAGDLSRMHDYTMANRETHVEIYSNHGHSFFAVTPLHLERVGEFDENLYPSYLEDCDDARRMFLTASRNANCPGINAIHGEAPHWGSSTIMSNEHYRMMNGVTHGANYAYYRRKWGGDNGGEVYRTPFNDPAWPINRWVIDPDHRAKNSIW